MRIQYLLFLFFIFINCKKATETKNNIPKIPPKSETIKIKWLTDKKVMIEIDNLLSYNKGFKCDSVIAFDYIGFESEHSYYPINKTGQFINTIRKKQKLNNNQILKLSSIIENKETYKNPNIAGCYEPRLAFVYFKNNKVICQTQICLNCYQLQSTAELGDGEDGNFNDHAAKELENLKNELGFK